MNRDISQNRIEQLRQSAEMEGFTSLIIFSKGARNISGTSTHGYLRYLMDWTTWGSLSVLLLPVNGEPVLLVPIMGDVEQAEETIPWIKDVRTTGGIGYGKAIYNLLLEKDIRGRIGTFGFDEQTHSVYRDLHETDHGWLFEPAEILLDRELMIKDSVALEKMQRAAQTCDVMLASLAEELRKPALPAWKAQVLMENAGRLDGAEVVWSWFVTGANPDHPRVRREENSRIIQVGDCIVAGIILIYEGFYGHSLRMFTIGEPSPSHLRLWQAVGSAQREAAESMVPGVGISQPNAVAEGVLFSHFPEMRSSDKIRFRPCHFIGMDYAEYPTSKIISNLAGSGLKDEMMLQEGMTMEVHPNIRPPELGFGAIGDVYVVTPNGGKKLSSFTDQITIVEPK